MSLITQLRELQQERKTLLDAAGAILTTCRKENRELSNSEEREWNQRHELGDKLLGKIHKLQDTIAKENGRRTWEEHQEARDRDCRWSAERRTTFNGDPFKLTLPHGGRFQVFTDDGQREVSLREIEDTIARSSDDTNNLLRMPGVWEARTLSAATGNLGGYTVPQGFVYKLDVALKYFGGILQAAEYIDTDMGNLLPWPSINDTANSGEMIGENAAVMGATGGAAEQDPAYGVVNFNAFMCDSGLVKVPIQLIDDSAFDLEDYLARPGDGQLAIRIGRQMNTKCTTGNGTTEPMGCLTAATLGVAIPSPTAITYNNVLDLIYSVDKTYRKNGSLMFHDSTEKALRKLTDSNSRPLWIAGGISEGIQNRQPDTLAGYPTFVSNDMPQIASSQKSMLFGDFSKYKIRRVKEVRVAKLVERFIDTLNWAYIAYLRYDGNLIDAGTHPLKYAIQSAT